MAQTPKKITVDIVSDVMCPWCYIGKRRFEKAAALTPDIELDVRWRPYQLDGTLPPDGKDRDTYLSEKFGSIERARSLYENVKAAGVEEDIPFAFDKITKSPNTLNAHRLIRWAGSEGLQDEMVEKLFQLYFLEGADLTDVDVLVDVATEIGMDRDLVSQLLADGSDVDAVQKEVAMAQQMGVTGVPCFIIDNKYAVTGAQDAETLAGAFRQIAEAEDNSA